MSTSEFALPLLRFLPRNWAEFLHFSPKIVLQEAQDVNHFLFFCSLKEKIMKHFVAKQLFMLALCSFVSIASAQNIDATDPNEILNIAKGFGSAELNKDNTGDPNIVGRISGTKYAIFFYGCRDGGSCKSLQFVASWKTGKKFTLEKINEWNRKKRYAKAHLDDEGDPVIKFDVEIEYGMSRRNLDECLKDWELALIAFRKELLDSEDK
jgi:G:T-mismatch repair DNA endonuclease (very short patch repair protein)